MVWISQTNSAGAENGFCPSLKLSFKAVITFHSFWKITVKMRSKGIALKLASVEWKATRNGLCSNPQAVSDWRSGPNLERLFHVSSSGSRSSLAGALSPANHRGLHQGAETKIFQKHIMEAKTGDQSMTVTG